MLSNLIFYNTDHNDLKRSRSEMCSKQAVCLCYHCNSPFEMLMRSFSALLPREAQQPSWCSSSSSTSSVLIVCPHDSLQMNKIPDLSSRKINLKGLKAMYTQINHTELIICPEILTKTYIQISSFTSKTKNFPWNLLIPRIYLGSYFNTTVMA